MIFLIQTPHLWRGIAQRSHHLARRFARRGHSVHWVEPRYLRWITQRPADFRLGRRERPETNIQVRPQLLINGERLPFIRAHNQFWLAQAMKAGLRGHSPDEPIVLMLYNPHEGDLVDRVPHDLVIYDIMDEFRGFPWSPPRIAEEEADLLRHADWVFAGTGALFDAKREQAEGRIECLLSGVETKMFAEPMGIERTTPEYRELRQKYRRIAGYAGMIDLRIDQPLLRRAAAALPEWGFVLIGPVQGDASGLGTPNIHLLGPQPYATLPAYYQSWDASLLPFVQNSVTLNSNPTKMLEYGAAGKPIVARALPEVERFYSDGAWLYLDADQFVGRLKSIEAASEEELAPRLARARGWADDRDWDPIADRMLKRIEGLLADRAR